MDEKIIDFLYDARYEDFEHEELRKDKSLDEGFFYGLELMKKVTKDFKEEDKKLIEESMDEITHKYIEYNEIWNRKYYKLGIQDGLKLHEELFADSINQISYSNKFFNGRFTDFTDFIEHFKVHYIYNDLQYDKNRKEISKILDSNPRIRNYIEDEEIVNFTKEELESLFKVMSLRDDQSAIENAYIFKLGIKEGKF